MKEINGDMFQNWLKNKILTNPEIPEKSIIVLDNAPSHSQQNSDIPKQRNNKKYIQDWLTSKNIKYPKNSRKADLLNIVKQNFPDKEYIIDQMIIAHGHIPIRLPPYHCHLNPIELVWAQMKKFIGKFNLNNNKEELKQLIKKSFTQITPENWKNYVNHCKEIEKIYWESEGIIESNCDKFVVNFENEYCDSDDENVTFEHFLLEYNNNINLIDHDCTYYMPKKLF
jgi:transposase